jgi:predicted peroxiredoxin
MSKILSIVETAYRATLEEQDDTILWLNTMFKNGGADVSILFRSNAVNYVVKGQNASGLQIGKNKQAHPPTIEEDVAKLVGQGVPVYVDDQDLKERGLAADNGIIDGVRAISRSQAVSLMEQSTHIWHW